MEQTRDLVILTQPSDMAWLIAETAKLPPGSTVLELGAFLMGSSVAMARANSQVTVHAVDTGWLHWVDFVDHPGSHGLHFRYPEIAFNSKLAEEIRTRQLQMVSNIVWHKGWSRSVHPDPAPTLCFIDADHSTSAVIADFFHCWNVAAEGALIVGDNIQMPTVRKAVEQIAGMLNSEPTFAGECLWYWRKDSRLESPQ